MVDSTLAALAGTRGIVLDGRGYPGSPAYVMLMMHLHGEGPPPIAAKFEEFTISSPDLSARTSRVFTQSIRPAVAPRYTGRTALLIDERAISQAEHLGLHFRAANGTIFVGSPTMGANGAVTNVQQPGGLRVSFTGQRVMHPDGQPLQRVGLQPDVPVKPTIAGTALVVMRCWSGSLLVCSMRDVSRRRLVQIPQRLGVDRTRARTCRTRLRSFR
jgi:hypothetical protein